MDKTVLFIVFALAVLVSIPTYLIWPFELDIQVVTSGGKPLVANITVYHSIGPEADRIETSNGFLRLWKGEYLLKADSPGFEQASYELSNPLGFQLNHDMNLTIVMRPVNISLARFDFRDPTGSMKLFPWLEIAGTSASGETIRLNVTQNTLVESGWYTVRAADPHFNATFHLETDKFKEGQLTLEPNELFEQVDKGDAEHAINFLADYVKYTRSLPLHLYIPRSGKHMTLGEMIALTCQQKSAEEGHRALYSFYLIKDIAYRSGAGSLCYLSSLDGAIPLESLKTMGFPQPKGLAQMLNQGRSRNALALTFDIESGLYVNKKSQHALSPCHNETTRLGVAPDDLTCSDPSLIPWFSPLIGPHNGGLPYPWATGREGLDDILSIPEKYGLPVTLFVTPRDMIVLETLDPGLRARITLLAKNGLVEIGAQNWYHSQAGARKITTEQDDLRKTKAFLENEFGVNVSGSRMPYFGLLRSNPVTHDDLIINLGFKYYSGLSNQRSSHNIPYTHKLSAQFQQINGTTKSETIIDGKPWDFTHRQTMIGGEESLARDPSLRVESMAKILRLVSEGATVVTMESLSESLPEER